MAAAPFSFGRPLRAERGAQSRIAGILALESHQSNSQGRSPDITVPPLGRDRQLAVIDFPPGFTTQVSLVDSGDIILDANSKVLRFKRHVVHT
jgi:hypothetical protein